MKQKAHSIWWLITWDSKMLRIFDDCHTPHLRHMKAIKWSASLAYIFAKLAKIILQTGESFSKMNLFSDNDSRITLVDVYFYVYRRFNN